MNAQILSSVFSGATAPLQWAGRRFVDFLTPPVCPVTGEAVAEPASLSAAAWRDIQFIERPYCDACGAPFANDYGENVLCPACIAAPPVFDRARAALVYDDASHKLVVAFKHSDRTETAAMFGAWMARAARDLTSASSLIVPTPLHSRRLLARRYNQSALLASETAKRLGAQFAPSLLERIRATPPQKALSASARARNVAGAFRVPAAEVRRIKGAHVILIDDVLTTGATLSAAAKVIKRAGASRVDALVLARVVKGGVGAI